MSDNSASTGVKVSLTTWRRTCVALTDLCPSPSLSFLGFLILSFLPMPLIFNFK